MSKKNILMLIIAVIFLGIAFMYLTRNNTTSDSSSLSVNSSTAPSADAQYIYSLLQRMSAVKLDDSIFSSAVFQSLKDNTVVLTAQQTGRNNPFSPIGTDTGVTIQATTTGASR